MRINTFFYSIRQGLKNIFRNKMFSLASVATMAACIFMFGMFYSIVNNFVNDLLRDLDLGLIYLDTPVNEYDENACTIGALIPDYKYNPETSLIEKETITKEQINVPRQNSKNAA